jgi:hypothetical protein
MRALFALTLSTLLTISCAAGEKSTRAKDEPEEQADDGSGETDCLRQLARMHKHYCIDRPGELSEGYAARAREAWEELAGKCDGTRGRRALRAIDECIAGFESEPGQTDNETHDRLEAAKSKAATLRADDVIQALLRKLRNLRSDADSAADAFKAARKTGDANERKFRKEECDHAERDLRAAEDEVKDMLKKNDLDVRDRHALGLW